MSSWVGGKLDDYDDECDWTVLIDMKDHPKCALRNSAP